MATKYQTIGMIAIFKKKQLGDWQLTFTRKCIDGLVLEIPRLNQHVWSSR